VAIVTRAIRRGFELLEFILVIIIIIIIIIYFLNPRKNEGGKKIKN